MSPFRFENSARFPESLFDQGYVFENVGWNNEVKRFFRERKRGNVLAHRTVRSKTAPFLHGVIERPHMFPSTGQNFCKRWMGVQLKNVHISQFTTVPVFYFCGQELISLIRGAKYTSPEFRRSIANENCQSFATCTTANAPEISLTHVSWEFRRNLFDNSADTIATRVPYDF